MIDTIGLLEETPHKALVSLINHYNSIEIDPDHIEFNHVSSMGARKTKVIVSPKRNINPFVLKQYDNLSEFYYNRLNLTTFFSKYALNLNIPLPTSTHTLLSEIKNQLGFILEEDEFVLEEINPLNASPYRLKAKSHSLRWVGHVDINVVKRDDLSEVIEHSNLDRFWDINDLGKRFVGLEQKTTDGMRYGGHLGTIDESLDLNVDILTKLLPEVSQTIDFTQSSILFNDFSFSLKANQYHDGITRSLIIKLNNELNDFYIGNVAIHYNLAFLNEISPFPKAYKKPIELFSKELDGVFIGNEIIKLRTGDVLTEITDEWIIGRHVFNNDPWVIEEGYKNFNAFNAKVIYNGFNGNFRRAFNPLLTHVLVIELSEECLNYSGTCFIYYNLSMVS